jgi:para-nitrobenzyl esterase
MSIRTLARSLVAVAAVAATTLVVSPASAGPHPRGPGVVRVDSGGGFVAGAAQEYDGARLATTGDLMVVTVNYRLGALGFLSSPELDAGDGNYGLMDQSAALRWVRRNAARFGGDPDTVTLAGQSAGARAVCAHLAAPVSRGMFYRAISQSGAPAGRPGPSSARQAP